MYKNLHLAFARICLCLILSLSFTFPCISNDLMLPRLPSSLSSFCSIASWAASSAFAFSSSIMLSWTSSLQWARKIFFNFTILFSSWLHCLTHWYHVHHHHLVSPLASPCCLFIFYFGESEKRPMSKRVKSSHFQLRDLCLWQTL